VVLEKPVGATVAEAERLADAIGAAGVASLVLLTLRYAPEVAGWVRSASAGGGWATGTATWVGGALLGGPFSHSPWRHERGGLVDIGPHTIDLLDAGIGPIVEVLAATRAEHDVWQVLFGHENGARSSATMSIALPVTPYVLDLRLYGRDGHLRLPAVRTPAVRSYGRMLDEFVAMIRDGRTEHPLDVRRGVYLQRLIERVERLAVP
jgi:predicted dehydrogenase